MRHRDIHPSVLIEIEDVDAICRGQLWIAEERCCAKRTLARIGIERWRWICAGHNKVDRAIVVQVGESRVAGRSVSRQSSGARHVGKCLIAVIAPQNARAARPRQRLSGHKQIKVAVVVVVHKGKPRRLVRRSNPDSLGDIREFSVA